MISVSEIAGNFGAGFIPNSWNPARYNTIGDALTPGALGLAYHTVKNVVQEFLPDRSSRSRKSRGRCSTQHHSLSMLQKLRVSCTRR